MVRTSRTEYGAGIEPCRKQVRSQHGSAAGCDSRQRALRGGDPRDNKFCDATIVEKKRAVEEINEQIKVLKAKAAQHATTAAELTKEIASNKQNILTQYDVVESANEVRQYSRNNWYEDARWKSGTDSWNGGWQRGNATAE